MKLAGFLAIVFSFAGIVPSLASYQSDSANIAGRNWADEPFDLGERYYDVYERGPNIAEEGEDLWEREALDLWERASDEFDIWERSQYDEEELLYRRAPTAAYQKVIALKPSMQAGKSYAFEMTFPLTDKEKNPQPKETEQQKQLRELQIHLGYSHKALLVGTLTQNKDFDGQLYHMSLENIYTWNVASKSLDWKVESGNPLSYKGEVKSGWTKEKIIKAGKDLTFKDQRSGKYGFAEWNCGTFADELFVALTGAPPN